MRKPSLLVPAGAVVATIGIHLPVVRISAQTPGAKIPVVSDLVTSIPAKEFGATADQRAYLLGVLALALAAWLVPRLAPRTNVLGWGLAVAAAAIAGVGATRGWLIATRGPHALVTDDSSFVERGALAFLDRLHADGVLVLHPAAGLWTLSVGAGLLVIGALLPVLSAPRSLDT